LDRQHRRLRTTAAIMPYGRLCERPDADWHRNQIGCARSGLLELSVDLSEQCLVAVDDPGRHLFIPGPGSVLDELCAGTLRICGGFGNCVVVARDRKSTRLNSSH